MVNIWHTLPKPFLVLAPLEGVTDTVFRRIVGSCAAPDVYFTEFTSADGYCSAGKAAVAENFRYTEKEKPIIAQIWGKNPETMYRTAVELSGMGFAGIDINMSCPASNVMDHGCGAAMINTPEIARDVIAAVKRGAGALPVSVKTRIGTRTIVTDEWIPFLLEQGIDAITVHGRTAREMSKVPAHWDEIAKVVQMRNRMNVATKIIGNGDVANVADALAKHRQHGVDGIMIGRGIFNSLWAFDRTVTPHVGTTAELLEIMGTHIRLFDEVWGDRKNYALLKKFFKIYVNGFPGAVEWRVKFMETQHAHEALSLLSELATRVPTE